MNTRPLTAIDCDDVAQYARHGVVCLRQQFDGEWIEMLLAACQECIARPDQYGHRGLARTPGFVSLKWPSRDHPALEQFFRDSPAAEIVGKIIGSRNIRFFNDQIFAKEAGVSQKTFWHHDAAGWPVSGEQVPSLWIPLTPVCKENSGLVVVEDSHANPALYWPLTDNSKHLPQPAGRTVCPDFDEDDQGCNILDWDMQPGDALLFHPRMVHAAGGNNSRDQHRIALTSRWFGDDIRWDPRPECVVIPHYPQSKMRSGCAPSGSDFPLYWSA